MRNANKSYDLKKVLLHFYFFYMLYENKGKNPRGVKQNKAIITYFFFSNIYRNLR